MDKMQDKLAERESLRAPALIPFSYFAAVVMVAFGVVGIVELGHFSGVLSICLGVVAVLNALLYSQTRRLVPASIVLSFLMGVTLSYIFYTNETDLVGDVWLVVFPVPIMLLLGRRYGMIAVGLYSLTFLPALLRGDILGVNADSGRIMYIWAVLVVLTALVYMYEVVIERFFVLSVTHNKRLVAGTNELSKQIEQRENIEARMREVLRQQEENNHKLEELTQIDEATISSIGEAVLMVGKNGVTTRANVSAGRILGINQTELLNQKISKLLTFYELDGDEQLAEEQIIIATAIEHRSINEETYKIIRPDKSFLYAHMTASPLVVNGIVFGVAVVVRDVTQEINVDQAKTEFVSIASHQLRTPLSTINWYLEMVLAGDFGPVEGDMREFVQEAYDASQRMGSLIDALLSVSRIDVGVFAIDPKPTDINGVISDVMTDLTTKVKEKKMNMDISVSDDVGQPMFDPRLINIVFLNLISNAVKYTPAEGTVTVKVGASDELITIDVSDTGYGIPEHQQDQIFSKLFRAQNAVEFEPDGTGLGLYIVKAIIDEVHGTIGFTSKEGQGTTFSITLPRRGMQERKGAREIMPNAGV